MASLSLPRVLHPRKTSLEVQRENFEKLQTQALSKAVNSNETPVKQKHVRSAIIGTFHTQGATTFWAIALRLPAMDDRIVAWKLCHVVHKILREGHPLCLVHSQRHIRDLDEIGKLWVHLKDGYGKMIRLYTTLLMTKLDFHRKNPRFPGHLGVTSDELESIGGNDINTYFQLSVEMFDYLENIIDLQAAVFGSLDMARSNSMTSAGQCRLAPLIPCIQDASKLYDYCVKILFKLHFSLPPDILEGHRQRFLKQFKLLKQFYQNTSNLQYFKDLIAIPPLPENPPNFLIQSDLRTYVTQEVFVPQEPEEEHLVEANLIDTSDSVDLADSRSSNSASPGPVYQEIVLERDSLRNHCEKLSSEMNALSLRHQKIVDEFQTRITNLETDLASRESELIQERQVKEELMNQAFAVAQSQDSEQKVKDEKFGKLKEVYVKLRNDHIKHLREKADIEKKLTQIVNDFQNVTEAKTSLESTIVQLQSQISDLESRTKQADSELSKELQTLQRDKEVLSMEAEILKKSLEEVSSERDNIITELTKAKQEKDDLEEKLENASRQLSALEETFDVTKKNLGNEIDRIIIDSIEGNEEILKTTLDDIDNTVLSSNRCSPDYLKLVYSSCLESLEYNCSLVNSRNAYTIVTANKITNRIMLFVLQGTATANLSPDINVGEKMVNECRSLVQIVLKLLDSFKNQQDSNVLRLETLSKLEEVANAADNINMSLMGNKQENLADMLEREMIEMDKAIEEAANRIQDMMTKSRSMDSGIKLEINSKLLDSCTDLMKAIRILVAKARLLQAEIVAQGKGTASAKEFYKRNHQWTDGFISAAKAVAVAANFLLVAADKVVSSNGKLEQLVVAAQEIAASTAQLVVASRVKAGKNSSNLQLLTQASKGVNVATATVVATVKDCSQLIDDTEALDTSNMSLHQAKKMEMESQVRVLELEKELDQERHRLLALRKHHYTLEDDSLK